MPLSPLLAAKLIECGHDAVHASEAGLSQAPDEEILKRAQEDARVVVNADLDYPRLLALTGGQGPGLVLFRGGDYREAELMKRLERLLVTLPASDLSTYIVVVEKKRIRRRRLPVRPQT
jgi:predicted nuclease of predicted toxin-antitoxin system